MPVCGAKTRAGGTCQQAGMPNGRCRMHGGPTPRGPASASYKTGRWSKCLPVRLAARYELSEKDPELFTLRSEVAALDSRLEELFGRLSTGESGAAWADMRKHLEGAMEALKHGDAVAARDGLNAATELVRLGDADERQWREIRDTIRDRAKAVGEERRHAAMLQTMIPAEQAISMMARLLDVVKENIQDRSALSRIALEVDRLSRIEDTGRVN